MISTPLTAIVYDWYLDIRSGGPTGYLANLQMGLQAIGNSSVNFITRGPLPESENSSKVKLVGGPLVQFNTSRADFEKSNATDIANNTIKSLESFERSGFSKEVEEKVLSSNAFVFHVHTTRDCVKLHFLLTRHGIRHHKKILLMSHCPEIPAREQSDITWASTGNAKLAENVFWSHLLVDKLAFVHADAVLFPCDEAAEPYEATWDGFTDILQHKPFYTCETGVEPLLPTKLHDPKEHFGVSEKFTLGYMGRHNEIKGYDFFVRVCASYLEDHSDVAIVVAGGDSHIKPPSHARWVEAGWTKTPQDVIAAADVVVIPNRLTYFDLSFLEILSAGKVILASKTGGNKYFEGKSSGVILYEGEEDFRNKLDGLKLLSAKELLEMSKENKALFSRYFTKEVFARRYVKTVDKVIEDFSTRRIGALARKSRKTRSRNVEISVVVPVYNVESYLETCLQSIAAQSFNNFEVILVDDGSSDGSSEILEKFAKKYGWTIVQQNNQGLSQARNSGLDYVRGTYCCFIDSDDYLHPQFLEVLHSACEKNGTDMAICAVEIFDETHSAYHSTSHEDCFLSRELAGGRILSTAENVSKLFPSAWNKLYRTEKLSRQRWPIGYLYEDNPFFVNLAMSIEKLSFTPRPLYFHRDDRPERISKLASERVFEIAHIFCLTYSSYLEALGKEDADKVAIRLLPRLFWERFWNLNNGAIRTQLEEIFRCLSVFVNMNQDGFLYWKDGRIEPNFYSDILMHGQSRKEGFGASAHIIDEDRLKIVDRSSDLDIVSGQKETGRVIQKEDKSVLIHPEVGGILTIAEMSGFGQYGKTELQFDFALENEQAMDTEIRVLVWPEKIVEPSNLIKAITEKSNAPNLSPWRRLEAEDAASIVLKVEENFGPTTTCYLVSRSCGESNAFAWLHLRNVLVFKDEPL